jgi:hypothetical protein
VKRIAFPKKEKYQCGRKDLIILFNYRISYIEAKYLM